MSDPISAITPHLMPQGEKTAGGARQEAATRSFQNVLQDGGTRPRTVEPETPDKAGTVSGAELDKMRTDLTRRLNQIPRDKGAFDDIWPELLRTRTRMSMLREAMSGVEMTPRGTNLKGLFGKVEGEWYSLEQVMRSDKDLSSGELLGLQARLYQVSQHIDVMSKVVDQMTGGIKTILNTNV
jgi:hypothetical protein